MDFYPKHWTNSAFLVRSPLVRLASVVPIIGYIILYGDTFDNLFNFESSLDESHFLIPPDVKIRMTYYGGLIIAVSILIYLARCPRLCRRHVSIENAIDEFMRVGSTEAVQKANSFLNFLELGVKKSPLDRFMLKFRINNLCGAILDVINNRTDLTPDYNHLKEVCRDWDKVTGHQFNIEVIIALFKGDLDPQHPLQEEKEWLTSEMSTHIIRDWFLLTRHHEQVLWMAKDAVQTYYQHLYIKNRLAQITVWFLSIVGVTLCFLPAIDVLILVISSDIDELRKLSSQ